MLEDSISDLGATDGVFRAKFKRQNDGSKRRTQPIFSERSFGQNGVSSSHNSVLDGSQTGPKRRRRLLAHKRASLVRRRPGAPRRGPILLLMSSVKNKVGETLNRGSRVSKLITLHNHTLF